jgi:hypothetical protein
MSALDFAENETIRNMIREHIAERENEVIITSKQLFLYHTILDIYLGIFLAFHMLSVILKCCHTCLLVLCVNVNSVHTMRRKRRIESELKL